jgi:ketosteroid isomerase-like protein
MSADDVQVASQFLAALEAAMQTGEREAVYALLAADVEWVAPQRTLKGLDELKEKHTWGLPPEQFDVEFEDVDLSDLGDGRLVAQVREAYRWKETGERAHHRDRRIEVTIRSGKIARYEMRNVG